MAVAPSGNLQTQPEVVSFNVLQSVWGAVRKWEAAEASTYDSSGVFGFHAVGRFLSGLFEAFFSLFHPKKDQDAHWNTWNSIFLSVQRI